MDWRKLLNYSPQNKWYRDCKVSVYLQMLYVLRRHIWFNHRTNSGERMQFFFIKGYYDQYMGGYFPISQEIKNENQTWYKLKRVTKLKEQLCKTRCSRKKWCTDLQLQIMYMYIKIKYLNTFYWFSSDATSKSF